MASMHNRIAYAACGNLSRAPSLRLSRRGLFPFSSPFPADIKYYRYILQTVHAGADLDFIVSAAKWVLEKAGDHALVATLDEASAVNGREGGRDGQLRASASGAVKRMARALLAMPRGL